MHDYVAIPGLGGFVAQYKSAERHPVSHAITPPNKQLTFNRQLQRNDGLLQHRLIEVLAITPDDARQAIQQFVSTIKGRLDNRDVVKLDGIGKLFMDVEGNTRFVQAPDTTLLPAAYGLPSLQLQPVLRQKVVDLGPAVSTTTDQPRRKGKWYAAAATLALILSLVTTYLTVPVVQQETNTLFGWDTSFTTAPQPWQGMHILPPADIDITAYYPLTIPVQLEAATVDLSANDLEQPLTIESNGGIPEGYFVIIGSFQKHRNADILLQELSNAGHQAWQFPANDRGYSRVGIFVSANDLLSANKQLLQLKDSIRSDAWMLLNR